MKKRDVEIVSHYVAKISGRLTVVRVYDESPYGGWDATNVATGRAVRIRTAAKLRRRATAGEVLQAHELHRRGSGGSDR